MLRFSKFPEKLDCITFFIEKELADFLIAILSNHWQWKSRKKIRRLFSCELCYYTMSDSKYYNKQLSLHKHFSNRKVAKSRKKSGKSEHLRFL